MFSPSLYKDRNQQNYSVDAMSHAKLGLKATLYLAYRDCRALLQKHLFDRCPKETYRIFDLGCGAGISTSIYAQIIREAGYNVEIVGADISEQNLLFAKSKVPDGLFVRTALDQSLDVFGKFDLVICNFVLVEHPFIEMQDIIKKLRSLLNDNGVLITTNATCQAYKSSNQWYTLNNHFEENLPQELKSVKPKLKDDQKVSLAVNEPETGRQLFRFFDFFHSSRAYKKAYLSTGLRLVETHRPLGDNSDGIPWKSERKVSPYKIQVLYPDVLLEPQLDSVTTLRSTSDPRLLIEIDSSDSDDDGPIETTNASLP